MAKKNPNNISQIMERKNINLRQLHERINQVYPDDRVSLGNLQRIINRQEGEMGSILLMKLAHVLDVEPNDIIIPFWRPNPHYMPVNRMGLELPSVQDQLNHRLSQNSLTKQSDESLKY